jgi:hypothetical protein
MVILGGLEIVAGGYLVHRYHKKQKKKKRLVEETQQRRDNAFSAAKLQPCHAPQLSQPTATTEQKYGYVANASPSRPPPPFPPLHRPYTEPPPHRPHNAPHAFQSQQFMIPRRPVPKRYNAPPPHIIQPLQRADSFATISRMPVANGYRPTHDADDHSPPPHRENLQLSPLSHAPMNSPYSNHGFAVSSPALGNHPTTPTSTLGMHSGRYTVDDNWETYNPSPGRFDYAPSVSTALGEHRDDDPPPPYRP